jgi:acetylornithine/succinyldiaminopimelate/putrescine aminotransferase
MASFFFHYPCAYLEITIFSLSSFTIHNSFILTLFSFLPFEIIFLQGIGNGIPLGAVVTTPEIAQVLTQRSYFNTFGGNPVCTAGGHAVLKVLEKEKLQENAHIVGSHLKDRLSELKEKHESKSQL